MANFPEHFERQYQLHLKHLKLKGLPPKTIDAYARGMRRIGKYLLLPGRCAQRRAVDRVLHRFDRPRTPGAGSSWTCTA